MRALPSSHYRLCSHGCTNQPTQLTTSQVEEDIYHTYDLGVNSFISKPVTFGGLVTAMQTIGRYWFEIVDLPPELRRATQD